MNRRFLLSIIGSLPFLSRFGIAQAAGDQDMKIGLDFSSGPDLTVISSGTISAGTITTGNIVFPRSTIAISGLALDTSRPGFVSWGSGEIRYYDANDDLVSVDIPSGTSERFLGYHRLYIYWKRGDLHLSSTIYAAIAFHRDNVVIAACRDNVISAAY